jgi:hypothetical protein
MVADHGQRQDKRTITASQIGNAFRFRNSVITVPTTIPARAVVGPRVEAALHARRAGTPSNDSYRAAADRGCPEDGQCLVSDENLGLFEVAITLRA